MASPSIPEGGTSSGSHDHVPTSVAATTAPTATVDQPAGDADSGVPRWQQNLSGVWAVDPARSDKPYEMLAQLGMTVFARKLRDRGRVSVAITHSPDKLVVEERSSLARTTSTAYELDGQPHQATVHNKPAQVAAQWVGCKLIIDTSFCDGTATRTVATRMLADVDTQVHEVRVFKDDLLTCTCRRTLVRDLSKPQPKFVESLRFLHATAKGGMQAHVGGAPRSSFGPDSEAKGTTHQTQDSGGRRVAWTQTPASVQRAYVGLAWLVVGAAIALVASWLPQALLPAVGCFVVWEGWTRFVAQPSALPPTNEPSNGPSREGMEGTAAPSHSALQPGKKNK